MKRLFTLALVSSLILGPSLQPSRADLGRLWGDHTDDAECMSASTYAALPVVVSSDPCQVVPYSVQSVPSVRTVRRIVPRTTVQSVTKTIMVPETATETRQVQAVEYRDEARERTYTVYEQVPEQRQITTQQTIMVPETRQRIETYTVQVPYERTLPQTYSVNSYRTESRIGTREIVRCVPSTEMRTVVRGGEVQKRTVESPNGGVKVQSVVVGGCKTQEPVTVMRKQVVRQTYRYDVQVPQTEVRTRSLTQTEYRSETRTRTVPEVVQVPKVENRVHTVTEMKSVPRQKTETYTERVPHVVTKSVQVPVTKMVAKQVVEQVPVTTYDVIDEPVSDCVPYRP